MVFALSHLMAQGVAGATMSGRVAGRTAGMVALTALSFDVLERGGGLVLHHALAAAGAPGRGLQALMAAVILGFGAVTLIQLLLPRLHALPAWSGLYVSFRNGLYANAYFDLLVGARRLPASRRAPAATPGRAVPAEPASPAAVNASIDRVTHAHAPVWPLGTFVAVNPFLGLADLPWVEAADVMARSQGGRMTMPRSFYAEAIAAGRIQEGHLAEALADADGEGLPGSVDDLLTLLREDRESARTTPIATVADVVGSLTGRDSSAILTERAGAWAAAYFDEGAASWKSPWRALGPYQAFRAEASHDATPEIFGARGFRAALETLPVDATLAAPAAVARLGLREAALDPYLSP
jgi:hypothetical protein